MSKVLYHQPIKSHSHDHSHCDHSHSRTNDKKMLSISIAITATAMIFQFIYSIITNSLALLSDTLHMLSHVIALCFSLFAVYISGKKAGESKTFGFYRMEVIVAFINSITTAVFVIFIIYEAVYKIFNPETIDAKTLIVVATIGLLVNGITGYLLLRADTENLNIKSSLLHMASDLLSSVAVVIGGIVVLYTNAFWIDTILAFMIAFVIGKWSLSLIKQSINVLLESSPVEIQRAKGIILSHKSVLETTDIHISEITKNMYNLTAHIVIKKSDVFKFQDISQVLSTTLLKELNIGHCTFEPSWKDDKSFIFN